MEIEYGQYDLRVRDIFKNANKSFGVDNLLKKTRKREYVYARHAVAYYLHKVCKKTQYQSAKLIMKDHATIVHSVRIHRELMQYDKGYKEMYDNFSYRLKPKDKKRWLCKESEFKILTVKK